MAALSKTASKTDLGGECKKFFEQAQPVGTAVVLARTPDRTTRTTTRMLNSGANSHNRILVTSRLFS